MRALVPYIPALACGAMMLLICVPMMRRHHKEDSPDSATKQEVAALREEIARLKGESPSETHSEVVGG